MAIIKNISQLDINAHYSYADYLKWQLNEMVELIKGKIYLMSPAPSTKHQRISRELCNDFFTHFRKQTCQVFDAPFDVRLYDKQKSIQADKDIYTVIQPDLCVICDPNKLDERGCLGAPDLIIEILSPGNSKKEMQDKFSLYQESGVKEYWIVYTGEESISQFLLNENEKYELVKMYANDDFITPAIFPALTINLKDVFY